ncbi:MFS transporter [Streptomyces sp. NPDC007861]|uniref:MFS transporter n=1 Tax=Streptomyces sp. NPDC007861 TaxID=3154893 RepID=UPI0034020B86
MAHPASRPPVRTAPQRSPERPTTAPAPNPGVGTAPHPAPARPGATLAVTSAATAVALMNYTAPMLTLPATAAAFGTPPSAQAWLLNGTPLGLAAVLLVAGSLADDYGRRRIFIAGTLALGVTTGLGAFAGSTLVFTLARITQGAASAAILASSLGLLVHAFPAGTARIRATGVWGAFVSAGIAAGPLLAGALGTVDWRLAYAALAVAALVTGAFAFRTLTESRAPRGGRPDLPGALTLGLSLTALLTALTLGRDGWLRAPVGVLAAASVVLLAAFVLIERRTATPMIDLALFRRPLFLSASSGALFTGLAVIGLFSYLPAMLQRATGLSPLGAAWLFLLWSGTAFLVALQAKRLAGRVTARHQLVLGFVFSAAGVLAMLGTLSPGGDRSGWAQLLPGLAVAGVGSGLLNAALPRLSVESVPPERAAMGSGANNTARYIGSATGVALTIAVATAGTDTALVVSAGMSLLGAVAVLAFRDGHRAAR